MSVVSSGMKKARPVRDEPCARGTTLVPPDRIGGHSMRDTSPGRGVIPLPLLTGASGRAYCPFQRRISVGGSGGIFGRVFRVPLALSGTRWRAGPPYSSPSSPLGVRIRLLIQCRADPEGCQTLRAGGVGAGPARCDAWPGSTRCRRPARSTRGTNGTSVTWPQVVQTAGCIWRGLRPPKLANEP